MALTSGTTASGAKGLRLGALGLGGSVVLGIASTAPAYSLAATLGYVVTTPSGDGIIGLRAPLVMVLAFVPMYCVAVAFRELNRAEPDCGTTFHWVARAFGSRAGWMGGWGVVASGVIVMANLAQVAGTYSLSLVGADALAGSTVWSTVAGTAWIAVMTWVCYRGIEVSARLQVVLLSVELAVLGLFSVVALVKVATGRAPGGVAPSLDWLSPAGLGVQGVVSATLLAVFIYWGWDTAVSTNEETRDPSRTPGRAAVLSTVLLLVTYVLVTVATVSFAGVGTTGTGLGNPANADDVLRAVGAAVLGGGAVGSVLVPLLALAVLSSAAASTLTTILPTARTTLSMAAARALPERFARVHPRHLTPTASTVWMGGVSIVFYVLLTLVSGDVLADSIGAVGLLIAFYYGLTGFACAWYFRTTMWGCAGDVVRQGVLPVLGGAVLLGAFAEACRTYAEPGYGATSIAGVGGVLVIGVGTLALGVVLMLAYRAVAPAYFDDDPRR